MLQFVKKAYVAVMQLIVGGVYVVSVYVRAFIKAYRRKGD